MNTTLEQKKGILDCISQLIEIQFMILNGILTKNTANELTTEETNILLSGLTNSTHNTISTIIQKKITSRADFLTIFQEKLGTAIEVDTIEFSIKKDMEAYNRKHGFEKDATESVIVKLHRIH